MTIKRGTLHEFMAEQRPARLLFRNLWAANAVISLLLIAGGAYIFMQWWANRGIVPQRSEIIIPGLIVLVLLMLNGLKSAAAAWVTSADIEAGSDGIYLYLREGKPMLIGWEALETTEIKKTDMPLMFPMRGKNDAYTISVPELGLLYRLTGLEYGRGLTPVFVVTSAHEQHQKLMEHLEHATADPIREPETDLS